MEKVRAVSYLQEKGNAFQKCHYAVEAVDVTFQQFNRPSRNMQEGKRYFSGKHRIYGYKVEVAVRANGLASAYSKHYPGSVSDIGILTDRLDEHKWRLEKPEEDREIEDNNPLASTFPNHWAFLADKGYQGAQAYIRCHLPHKKPPVVC